MRALVLLLLAVPDNRDVVGEEVGLLMERQRQRDLATTIAVIEDRPWWMADWWRSWMRRSGEAEWEAIRKHATYSITPFIDRTHGQ